METVHHRAHVVHVLDDGHPTLKQEVQESRECQSDSHQSSLDDRYDMSINESLEISKTPSTQSKKELYIKLDEILITSLHKSFEVQPGATVDRVEMVEFLSAAVRRNLSVCPDLEKIMCLRDTVLTARVKRAFPEVEYKRKQIRQDHFRKAWLYVNIRRKQQVNEEQDINTESNNVKVRLEAHRLSSSNKTSVSTAGTWTPEIHKPPTTPKEVTRKQTPLNTQLPSTVEHHPSDPPPDGIRRDSTESLKHTGHYRKLAPLPPGGPVTMVTGFNPQENSAVVLDNYTVIKWVKMNYIEDSSSYVPVQDVVKAFKTTYGVDITYKECHQMIYSAFTSPRQRTCPLKTVRVSSMGAQYVYRGIAPVRDDKNDNFDEENYLDDSPQEPIVHGDFIHEEREEVWRKLVQELKHDRDQSIIDRDQSIMDRNQALSALMDLEKEHSKALTLIDQLRRDLAENDISNSVRLREEKGNASRRFPESSASMVESNMLSALATTCEKCGAGNPTYEHLKEERDQIWRDIVKQVTIEKEETRKRLAVVKKERDVYLERLHSFEKENQRLRDSVAIPCLPPYEPDNDLTTMQAIKLENRAQALRNSIAKTTDSSKTTSRDMLSSVLSHLRSKRKQSTPTKFSKAPRLSISENEPRSIVDSGSSPLDKVFSFEKFDDDSQDPAPSNNADGEMGSSPERSPDSAEMLLFFEGSNMVAFKPHPMED